MKIEEILKQPEGKTLEFKRDISSLKPILKTLVAFANTAGGILLIGRENDGAVHGVPEVLREEESLANAIADSIRPAMMPEIEIYSHNDKSLLVQRVFAVTGRQIDEKKLESLELLVPHAGGLSVSNGGLIL